MRPLSSLCANRDNNSASVLIDQKHFFLLDKYGAVIDFIDVPKLPLQFN